MQISSLLYRFNRSCHRPIFGRCFRRSQRWTQKGVLYAYGSRRLGASGNIFFRQNDSKLKFKKKIRCNFIFFSSSQQGSCIKKSNPFANHDADGEEIKCTLSNNEEKLYQMTFIDYFIKCCDIFRNNIPFYFGTTLFLF